MDDRRTGGDLHARAKNAGAVLELRPLMGVLRILDGERMQAELVLDQAQQLRIGLPEAYPDDMALLLGPISGVVDRDIGH